MRDYRVVLELVGTIEAAELPDGAIVVSAHGPLDGRVAGTLRDTLVPLAAAEDVLVLDLGDAHGMDDAALGVVSRAAHLIRRRGDTLSIVTRSPFIHRLIVESGLGDIVVVVPSLKDAIRQ